MRRRALWIAGCLLLLATTSRAEESVFSLTFLGIREEIADARAEGLGTLGVALGDTKTALSLNPASFAKIDRMTLSLVGGGTQRTSRDATIEDKQGDASFPHLRAALPLPGRFVFSVGFLGLRNFRTDYVGPKEAVGPIAYRHAFERAGSFYEVPIGIARSVSPKLHFGLTVDLLLGTVNESWVTGGDSLVSLRTRRRDQMDGTTVTLAVIGEPVKGLSLAATWSPSADLNVDTRTTIEDARLGSPAAALRSSREHSKAQYPATLRGGITGRLGTAWLVTADGLRRDWSDWGGRLYAAPRAGTEWRVGGGIEARPGRTVQWQALSYRVGVEAAQWPQIVGQDVVRETGVRAGAGYDLKSGAGRLDVALEYTQAGDLGRNGFEETRWTFLVSLTAQETWRRKSPRTGTR